MRKTKVSIRKPKPVKLPKFLSGLRVFLRTPRAADAEEFLQLMRASKTAHRNLVSPATTREDFMERVKGALTSNIIGLLICRKTDQAILGSISLGGIVRGNMQTAWIGYYLGSAFVGQGYMSEAIEVVLKLAFNDLHLHRVEAAIQPQNKRSIAVVRRLGFRHEGFSPRYQKVCGKWRDHERWAILVEEWRELRKNKGKHSTFNIQRSTSKGSEAVT